MFQKPVKMYIVSYHAIIDAFGIFYCAFQQKVRTMLFLILLLSSHYCCATQTIKGYVVDCYGKAISGATIETFYPKHVAYSVFNGEFSIPAKQYEELTIRNKGYKTKTVFASNNIKIVLYNDKPSKAKIGGICYSLYGNNALVNSCSKNSIGAVTIPPVITHKGKTFKVVGIEEYAFYKCSKLSSISIPDGVTEIGRNAFCCTGLDSIILPNSMTSISRGTFGYCENLKNIKIPECMTVIGEEAFIGCYKLSSLRIPDSLRKIGEDAFKDCNNLQSIYITDLVALCNLGFPSRWTLPGYSEHRKLFLNNEEVKELVIPNGVNKIEEYAFYGFDGIESVTLPSSVNVIENHAFAYCTALTSITIPKSVHRIYYEGFANCSKLISAIIPENLPLEGPLVFDVFPPKVEIIRKDVDYTPIIEKNMALLNWIDFSPISSQKSYNIKIGVKSDSKIEDVSVYVNGTLNRGIIPVQDDGYNMRIDRTIALNDGQNTIKVTVKNAGGIATTEKTVTCQNQGIATIDWLAFSPTTTEKQFVLKAGIKSSSKIESWTVSVNGVVDRGINPVKNDGYTLTIDKMLTLSEGSNIVKIEVRNAGGIAMAEKSVTYSPKKLTPIVQQKRIALVMGNANYRDIDKRLKNPVNDATDVAAKLESLGFTVIRSLDQTQQGMEAAINNFGNQARNYDVALFYYAGHGVRCNGSNYLIPIDANLPEESYVQYKCTNANLVLDLMDKAHCQMKIVILDACRNNPFARSWNRSTDRGGLNIMNAPKGTFIAFSTAPGDVAQDGAERNSPYTAALLQTFDVPNLSITDFFQEVLERVALKTNDRQTPWTSNSFRGKFIFNQK